MTDGPWWLEPLATGVSIIVGAAMIVWQQRASNQSQLKLKLFEELRQGLDVSAGAAADASMYAYMAPYHLEIHPSLVALNLPNSLPTAPRFSDLHFTALKRVSELSGLLESHGIVSEHFELFRRALTLASMDASQANDQLTQQLHRVLPQELPDGTNVPPPTTEDVAEFKARCHQYWQTHQTLADYIHDIKIEAQNVLLYDIFRRRVPSRKPPDSNSFALRTNDRKYLKRLRKYFFEDHPVISEDRQKGDQSERARGQ